MKGTLRDIYDAVDDFSKGKYKLVESDDIGVIHDRRISHVDSMDLDED